MITVVTPYLEYGDGERFVAELVEELQYRGESVEVLCTEDEVGILRSRLTIGESPVTEATIKERAEHSRLIIFHEVPPLPVKCPRVLWLDTVSSRSRQCFAQAQCYESSAIFCSNLSIWMALTIEDNGTVPILLLPHPVRTQKLAPAYKGEVRLTYVGRVTAEHLLEPLVAALPAFPQVTLQIHGWGPGFIALRQQMDRLGIEGKQVIITGERGDEWPDLDELASHTSYFVSPLHRGLSRCLAEGFARGVPGLVAGQHDYEVLFPTSRHVVPSYVQASQTPLYDLPSAYIEALATITRPQPRKRTIDALYSSQDAESRFSMRSAVERIMRYART